MVDLDRFRAATYPLTDPQFLNGVIDRFERQSRSDIEAAVTALAGGDAASFSEILHRDVGAASTLGAVRLEAMCRSLEVTPPSTVDGIAEALLVALEGSLAEFRTYIASLVDDCNQRSAV